MFAMSYPGVLFSGRHGWNLTDAGLYFDTLNIKEGELPSAGKQGNPTLQHSPSLALSLEEGESCMLSLYTPSSLAMVTRP